MKIDQWFAENAKISMVHFTDIATNIAGYVNSINIISWTLTNIVSWPPYGYLWNHYAFLSNPISNIII